MLCTLFYKSSISQSLITNKILPLLTVCADIEQELNEATSLLIREWAEKLLQVKFTSLRELALYLIDKMFVDHQSSAAHTVLSTMAKSRDGEY